MHLHPSLLTVLVSLASLFAGCRSTAPGTERAAPPSVSWALAIHGGAGTIDPGRPESERKGYEQALELALELGRRMLADGASALDTCEAVVRVLEDDPHFNAGVGAVFNERGEHELDASIMDGSTLRCGAVAGVRTVRNPVSLARLVMTQTRHVLLMGEGAEEFATAQGVERVPNSHFDTEARRRALEQVLEERRRTGSLTGPVQQQNAYGTVGCVARDREGRLAAATSTGGLTGKRYGRVGDTPVVGAGNYADDMVAVSGTGTGEQFIRHVVGHAIAARMRYGGQSLDEASRALVFDTLEKDDGGVIAVDRAGNVAMPFNSTGMYRGTADSTGRFEVRVFE